MCVYKIMCVCECAFVCMRVCLYFDKLLEVSNGLCTAFCRATGMHKRDVHGALSCVVAFRRKGEQK
jgi:hypothetical protein